MTEINKRLHILSFGLAFGITWAIGIFLLGLMATFWNWGGAMLADVGSVYLGFQPTLVGSLIGAAWAFVDGLIGGVLIAFFYNLFCRCCAR